jgi:hypothetical protein
MECPPGEGHLVGTDRPDRLPKEVEKMAGTQEMSATATEDVEKRHYTEERCEAHMTTATPMKRTKRAPRLVPTDDELRLAAVDAEKSQFRDVLGVSDWWEMARQRALARLYPEAGEMIRRRDTRDDGTQVRLPWLDVEVSDEYYRLHHFFHITMHAQEFLRLYLAGLIVKDENGLPEYIGRHPLRGGEANYALPGAVTQAIREAQRNKAA